MISGWRKVGTIACFLNILVLVLLFSFSTARGQVGMIVDAPAAH